MYRKPVPRMVYDMPCSDRQFPKKDAMTITSQRILSQLEELVWLLRRIEETVQFDSVSAAASPVSPTQQSAPREPIASEGVATFYNGHYANELECWVEGAKESQLETMFREVFVGGVQKDS